MQQHDVQFQQLDTRTPEISTPPTPTNTSAPTRTSESSSYPTTVVSPAAELTKRLVASAAVCGSELASRMEARRKMQEESADTGDYLQENDLLF